MPVEVKHMYVHVRVAEKDKRAFDRACKRAGETPAHEIRKLMTAYVNGEVK